MAEGRLRGVTYFEGKISDAHIRDTDGVVRQFVPVEHGSWVPAKGASGELYSCSVCLLPSGDTRYPYCPYCGAEMDNSEIE